jgi:arabinogalactan endo-1,4-beta-galactosidase
MFAKTFGAVSVALNGATSLTFTVSNPNTTASLSGIGFTDTMPAGLVVATPNGLTGSCGGGTIAAVAGSTSVRLSGATLAASASCNFALDVLGVTAGTQDNTTSAVTSTEGGTGKTASASLNVAGPSQKPPEPTHITPIDGDVYYILNQLSDLHADLINNSTTPGDHIIQQQRSFTNLSQRWAFTKLAGSFWQISDKSSGLCFDSVNTAGTDFVVQNPCAASSTVTQQWVLTPTSNGYYTIANRVTTLLVSVQTPVTAGTFLNETGGSGSPTQSQQWLLRPAYFRGVDNALLEKQEAARVSTGAAWWKDGGQQQDVLQVLKNHGVNMVRVRPTSVPPYGNASQTGCSGGACTAETEAQDLDLAKRAKNLGMSLQLTLFFDGAGSGGSVPSAWATHTPAQLLTDVHDYVKSEILLYRQNGVMPDMVAIGNEVNNGFLGAPGNVTNVTFPQFVALQQQAMQAVSEAAADTSMGPAIPPPLTCIHITPQWPMTDFFTRASAIPYDVICQSYYPFFHGPLTQAQANASNPSGQPVEEVVLDSAATSIGKPILILETGEHYQNGFLNNDPWYPSSQANQNQFLVDLRSVLQALPNNLAMGLVYWDPAGVDIARPGGGLFNNDGMPDAIYVWRGLTIFDNTALTPLPALDALGAH